MEIPTIKTKAPKYKKYRNESPRFVVESGAVTFGAMLARMKRDVVDKARQAMTRWTIRLVVYQKNSNKIQKRRL
jgi:hypothetical protein